MAITARLRPVFCVFGLKMLRTFWGKCTEQSRRKKLAEGGFEPETWFDSDHLHHVAADFVSSAAAFFYTEPKMRASTVFFAFRCSIAIYTKNLCLSAEKYPPMGLVEEGNADIINTNAPDPMQPDQGLVTPKSTKIRRTK